MNWNAVGALGELLGAAAVVLTLFYLARQVREASVEGRRNQEELRRSRYDALNLELTHAVNGWATDAELADIVLRGFTEVESLTRGEVFRFYATLHRFFRASEALFAYASQGGVHDWGTESWRANLADFIKFPGVQAYWNDRQHTYHDALQVEVDAALRKAGALMSEAYDAPGGGASGDSVGTA